MKKTASIIESIKETRDEINWQELLENIITAFDCTTGTIHTLDKSTNLLMLKSQKGIPDFLLPKMSIIPIGKGMAGIAAERRQPV